MVRNRNPFPNERDLAVAKAVSISYQYITVGVEDYVGNDPENPMPSEWCLFRNYPTQESEISGIWILKDSAVCS